LKTNPELTRNLWLELTPHRLIAMPAILGLIFALASTTVFGVMQGAALALFGLITILWGTQMCSESLLEEFRQGTWDTQRLSAMGPWQLAWGKLLGAPVFAWYGGAICLGVLIFSSAGSGFDLPILPLVLGALGLAVLAHAVGATVGLAAARSGLRTRSTFLLLGLLLLFPIVGPQLSAFSPARTIHWFGMSFSYMWFVVASLWAYAAWAVIGLWRLMCRELQVRKPPSAWLGFTLFLIVYGSGLTVGDVVEPLGIRIALVMFAVTLTLSYGVALVDPRDFISLRRLVLHWQSGNRRRVWEELPCWTVTLPLVLIAAIWLALTDLPTSRFGNVDQLGTFPLVLCLFALRDIALLHFFSLGARPQRALMTTLIYLGLLYWLLPSLLGAVGLDALAPWLRPSPTVQPMVAIAAGLLNAAVGVGLVVWRWRSRLASMAR